ncbi:30136_t:CDS:2 [Gigaspora margarita]|uniref:30136_t:CDS:1 n=1 Tax=Gigaspora margarita TaxID=4874 RepID=A0ABM8VX32_GIGMA|nr:30136_t:CDS:2 [Gigaspora margarita]
MVPLTDFTTNKRMLTDVRERKLVKFLRFIILGYPYYNKLSHSSASTGDIFDNPFSNIIGAIIAVYYWFSISFDAWPLISVIDNFISVTILHNIIISFMSDAFEDAVANSKSVYIVLN